MQPLSMIHKNHNHKTNINSIKPYIFTILPKKYMSIG